MAEGGPISQFVTVPMDQFPLKWRLTDPRYDVLPPAHLAQVNPLSPASARRLRDLIDQSGMCRGVPFANGYFRTVTATAIGEWVSNPNEDRRIRQWLYQTGLPYQQQVFLSYEPDLAIATTWKMLIRYWTSFYYPSSDDLIVVDESLNWALLFCHEEEVYFGTNLDRHPPRFDGDHGPGNDGEK